MATEPRIIDVPALSEDKKEHCTTPSVTLEQGEIDRIQELSRDQLIDLCMRMARQCGLSPCLTEDQIAQAMLDRLASIALKQDERGQARDTMAAINSWMDRKQGKAVQRIDQRIQTVASPAGDMTTAELLEALRNVKQLPGGVELLESGMLEITDADYISN